MHLTSESRQAALLTIGTWALSGTLYLIPLFLFQGDAAPLGFVLASVVLICGSGAMLSGGVYLVARAMRERRAAARFVAIGGAAIAGSAALALFDASASTALAALLYPSGKLPAFAYRATNNFVALVWQFALLGAVYAVLEANNLARRRERDLADARELASRAEAAASAARLAALRYQLNPHFLFNTLNAISSLIVTRDYAEADAMLAKLSEFLRATLATDPEGLTSVEDELATLQHYLEIESVRFGDRLAVEFACPPDLNDALLPGFLLQPLVENAIKYAVAPASRTVTIRVEAAHDGDQLVVMIEDDGDGGAGRTGTGVGHANVRQRLDLLYGGRAALETVKRERCYLATVRLPLARRVATMAPVA